MTSSIQKKIQEQHKTDEARAFWSQKTQVAALTIFAISLIEAGVLCYFLGTNSLNLEFILGATFVAMAIPSFVAFCIGSAGKAIANRKTRLSLLFEDHGNALKLQEKSKQIAAVSSLVFLFGATTLVAFSSHLASGNLFTMAAVGVTAVALTSLAASSTLYLYLSLRRRTLQEEITGQELFDALNTQYPELLKADQKLSEKSKKQIKDLLDYLRPGEWKALLEAVNTRSQNQDQTPLEELLTTHYPKKFELYEEERPDESSFFSKKGVSLIRQANFASLLGQSQWIETIPRQKQKLKVVKAILITFLVLSLLAGTFVILPQANQLSSACLKEAAFIAGAAGLSIAGLTAIKLFKTYLMKRKASLEKAFTADRLLYGIIGKLADASSETKKSGEEVEKILAHVNRQNWKHFLKAMETYFTQFESKEQAPEEAKKLLALLLTHFPDRLAYDQELLPHTKNIMIADQLAFLQESEADLLTNIDGKLLYQKCLRQFTLHAGLRRGERKTQIEKWVNKLSPEAKKRLGDYYTGLDETKKKYQKTLRKLLDKEQ